MSGQSVRSRLAEQGVAMVEAGRDLGARRGFVTTTRRGFVSKAILVVPQCRAWHSSKLDAGPFFGSEAWPHTLATRRGFVAGSPMLSFVRSRREPCVWQATQGLREN